MEYNYFSNKRLYFYYFAWRIIVEKKVLFFAVFALSFYVLVVFGLVMNCLKIFIIKKMKLKMDVFAEFVIYVIVVIVAIAVNVMIVWNVALAVIAVGMSIDVMIVKNKI